MSDEKQYTERDVILAKREAFMQGCEEVFDFQRGNGRKSWSGSFHLANKMYPLPKVTRARVVLEEELQEEWSLSSDRTFLRRDRGSFLWGRAAGLLQVTPSRVRVWADLLANPTEEVDA